MSAALIVVVLVCGYLYINSHIPSRIQFKKSTGWQSYFQVALKGAIYLSLSFIILFLIWLLLWLVLTLSSGFMPAHHSLTLAGDLLQLKFVGIGLPFVLLVLLTVLISVFDSRNAEKQLKDPLARRELFREIAHASAIESILLESLESNQRLLVSITLKSRKVYVGMVHEARFEEHDTDTVVLIPVLSGYRDKDTLTFTEDVNYAGLYQQQGITFDSQPLSLMQFRHVIPREQIEVVSLFDAESYARFKQQKPRRRGVTRKSETRT